MTPGQSLARAGRKGHLLRNAGGQLSLTSPLEPGEHASGPVPIAELGGRGPRTAPWPSHPASGHTALAQQPSMAPHPGPPTSFRASPPSLTHAASPRLPAMATPLPSLPGLSQNCPVPSFLPPNLHPRVPLEPPPKCTDRVELRASGSHSPAQSRVGPQLSFPEAWPCGGGGQGGDVVRGQRLQGWGQRREMLVRKLRVWGAAVRGGQVSSYWGESWGSPINWLSPKGSGHKCPSPRTAEILLSPAPP